MVHEQILIFLHKIIMGASQGRIIPLYYASSFRKPSQSSLFGGQSARFTNKILGPISRFSESLPKTVEYPKALDVLKPLSQIHINQAEIIERGFNPELRGSVTSTIGLDVVSKKGVLLLKLVYSRGLQPEEHKIDVYGIEEGDDKVHLADMDLERSVQYNGFVLCVKAPPTTLMSQVYELPGISQIAIARSFKTGDTMFQILMNGEFGWAESAQILSARGDRKIGRLYKRHAKGSKLKNALDASIHMPTDLTVEAKLTLIGTCLHLTGRYHN